MSSFQTTGTTGNLLLFVSLIPHSALFYHSVSIRLSLCLSCDPSIISTAPQCAVLFRLIASQPRFHTDPPSFSLGLCCFRSITLHCLPVPPASIVLPLPDSILFSHCPSLLHSCLSIFMSSCIISSYLFAVFCVLLGTCNLLHWLSVSYFLCFISFTWRNHPAFIAVPFSVSFSVSSNTCADALVYMCQCSH